MQVTSLEQLKQVKQTVLVNLGAFEDGTELIAELKTPDMMALMIAGNIPNTLLKPAMDLFNGKAGELSKRMDKNDKEAFKDMGGLLELLCDRCLINPTYKDIKDCGVELTMEMKTSVMVFAQGGVKALEGFRTEQERVKNNQPINKVQ